MDLECIENQRAEVEKYQRYLKINRDSQAALNKDQVTTEVEKEERDKRLIFLINEEVELVKKLEENTIAFSKLYGKLMPILEKQQNKKI